MKRNWKKVRTLCLVTVIGLLAVTADGMAQNKTHVVKPGETLYSIARQYNMTIQDLRSWNNLQSSELNIGQQLIVGRAESPDPVVHTVKPGETFFSISKTYGVNISEIMVWNNLQTSTLEIGQELTIHINRTHPGPATGSSEGSIVVNTNTDNNTYYTVKSGDTLYKIARDHNMTVDELKALNDLSSSALSIGQQLTVKSVPSPPSVSESALASSPQGKFANYRADETMELSELLQRFEMTETEFHALNPGFSSTSLFKGQSVTVLVPPTRTFDNPYRTGADLQSLGETTVSRYGSSEKGSTTTSGELYNPKELTAAHSNIALGTVMYVQNPGNGKGVYIRINDRISGSGLKLSQAAWQALEFASANPRVKIFQDQ